jgi:formylglycine-generating enzyme required for sulfatase activity/tRNA A-37 threonylcarbamoyl transferase component Bud32
VSGDAFDEFVKQAGLDAGTTAELLGVLRRQAPAPLAPMALRPGGQRAEPTSEATLNGVLSDVTADTEVVRPPEEPGRYEDRGPIARGGMGEVRRVFDRTLQRTVAMKALQPNRTDSLSLHRFHREAVVTAQLQHPAIVPIYELGQRPDGSRYYTMREVTGATLLQRIDELHRASHADWTPTADGVTLHQLVRALARVGEAVAFAHARGAVHRDLKPDNVMIGEFGDVQLLDWGLVKLVGEGLREPVDANADHTRWGTITGTPSYMAPEQATGELDQIGPPADVYGLGALLFTLLAGRPPYVGALTEVLVQLIDGRLTPPSQVARLPVPAELEAACLAAMAPAASARPTATAFVASLQAWLDGSTRRERAAEHVDAARKLLPKARALGQRAIALERRAEQVLSKLPPWAGEDKKSGAWELSDDAAGLARDARQLDLQARRLLYRALNDDGDCLEAHRLLARAWRDDHARAELAADDEAAERAEEQLRAHAGALPPDEAADHQRYLAGDGLLRVVTDPPGAEATLYRYEVRHRRWVATLDRPLGATPLDVPLPMGRYQLVLKRKGHHTVHYPVHIDRCAQWDGAPPGGRGAHAIALPRRGTLAADEVYVPAGWFRAGDLRCDAAAPPARVWVDAFIISRFPVTVAQWITFLDDLVARGLEAMALRHQPRRGVDGGPLLARGPNGRFVCADGPLAAPERPVVGVDHHSARAWLQWHGAQRGLPLRLPSELEWEKAARGVDGRLFPWGDRIDPTWARTRASTRTRPEPAEVDSYPVDVSPYGVRGMGGNVADWCADAWRSAGPDVVADRAVPPAAHDDDPSPRTVRGGSWGAPPSAAMAPGRQRAERDEASVQVGFRWARSIEPG